jgi:hypothetical protein
VSDHNERNRASRERLGRLGGRLGDRDVVLEGGWTAAGLLAHLAFWERMTSVRWRRHLSDGVPLESIDDRVVELVNAAALPQWNAMAQRSALADVMSAIDEIDKIISTVRAEEASDILQSRPRLVDRSLHRNEHLDEIERALG